MEDTARRAPDLSSTSACACWAGKTKARSEKFKFFFYPERTVVLPQPKQQPPAGISRD
jgi:hypothetical protein